MAEKTMIGGIPVECLTGEPAAIWSGWRMIGDRELVREASAKGTHVNLAHKCLGYRRNWSIEESQNYFNKEVEIWIAELLEKHQIYRASHILKNVGKNPEEHIFKICINCKDPPLRKYLSEYLINLDHFKSEYIESWNIIKSITEYEQKYMIQEGLSTNVTIEDVINLPENIKLALCTELYLSIHDEGISKNVKNNILWDYFLSNNEIDKLQQWIDVCYGDKTHDLNDMDEKSKLLFKTLSITPDMLDCIDSSNASILAKDLIKNHLCRYGIFVKKEQQEIKLMLSRIFSSALTLTDLDTILSYKSCNINRNEFLQNMEKELCLARCLQEKDSQEHKLKVNDLLGVLTKMCEPQEDYHDSLIEGIFKTIHFISDDVDKFLQQNYLIVLALIFLHLHKIHSSNDMQFERNDLRDIFKNGEGLQFGVYNVSNEVLQSTLKQVPYIESIIENKSNQDEITMYDLLDGYKNLNVKELFKWRFKNEPMPSFSNENLVKKYGYTETLTYRYYLKEARPTMAIQSLKHVQGKIPGSVSTRRKLRAALYAHILALRNLDKPEIICGCIAFIEMLGIDSENLRLHVTSANYVLSEISISIGNLLENVIHRNENDLQSVISYLETSFQKNLSETIFDDTQLFINAMKMWDVIVRFAKAHNTSLPDCFLKFLAASNQWLEFVLVCHTFSYPIDQVLENVKNFEDIVIREHLLTCLNNPHLTKLASAISNEQKLPSRDTRQSLYYKIGVEQNVSSTSGSPRSLDTNSSDSYVSTLEYHPIIDNSFSSEDDLWLTILKCHHSPDPPGALINASRVTLRPILTILATCYEPSSTAAYCYSWMIISSADKDILSEYKECLEHQIWSATKVFNLLDTMVSRGYIDTVKKAYKIFLPESSFNPFFEFLAQCANYGDFKGCQQYLLDFKSRCLALKCNKIMDWDCSDTTYLKNLYWIIVVAVKCIITTLGRNLPSTHLQIKFLEVVTKCNLQADLPVRIPDFQCLLKVTKILQRANVTLDFMALDVSDNIYNFDTEIQRCISDLLLNDNYVFALELSNAAGLDSSEIILAQYRNEYRQYVKKGDGVKSEFWNECALNFEKCNVPGGKAVEFFVEHAEKVASHKERYEILKLAFEILKNVETERETIDTLEMAMWKSCILAGPENIQLDVNNYLFNKLKTELLSGLNELKVSCTLTDVNEQNATEILINRLIDTGRLDIALRISTIFNYKHKDLQLLMLCLSLAEGETTPNELTAEQRSLLSETNKNKQQKYGALKNRGLQRLSSSSSLNASILSSTSGGESKNESIYKIQAECLSILQKLLEILHHGTDICLRVVLCYKLAIRLGKSYQFLLMLNNPLQFLQEVTRCNIENKSEILNDIIHTYKINCDNIAIFLAENITTSISRAVEDGSEDCISLWGYPLNTNFHSIMELCSDVSLLGWQLLKTAIKLLGHSQGEKRNGILHYTIEQTPVHSYITLLFPPHTVSTLKTIVELLIRSHDCFTTSCNMEGIASVLRKCQNLANTLQNLKHWTLLVRLVTGVGRFTEMNYVFQILKENDQFEFLLGQGLDKVTGLKIALLEFLKRQCPENKELFTLVALHFRLYYEIALMWEQEAKDVIKALITDTMKDQGKLHITPQPEVKFIRTENVQKRLQLAVTNYSHATQYYLQDNKLNLASRCSDQMQLVSLQLSLFNAVSNNQQVVCILNLKPDDVDKILCQILNFSQALTVMHAYNHHVDWANLIYCHCIMNGEMKYLKDFTAVNKLTPGLVQDCARRYRLEKSITHKMTDNMKALISELSDIECKYMLASQLGFKNIVESMLNNPMIGAYLKDTVWKKGYNAM